MDWMVNYICLAWKLACMLKTYRICNPTVGFLKYEFNNKLLDDATLLKVIPGVTWTQPYNNNNWNKWWNHESVRPSIY